MNRIFPFSAILLFLRRVFSSFFSTVANMAVIVRNSPLVVVVIFQSSFSVSLHNRIYVLRDVFLLPHERIQKKTKHLVFIASSKQNKKYNSLVYCERVIMPLAFANGESKKRSKKRPAKSRNEGVKLIKKKRVLFIAHRKQSRRTASILSYTIFSSLLPLELCSFHR